MEELLMTKSKSHKFVVSAFVNLIASYGVSSVGVLTKPRDVGRARRKEQGTLKITRGRKMQIIYYCNQRLRVHLQVIITAKKLTLVSISFYSRSEDFRHTKSCCRLIAALVSSGSLAAGDPESGEHYLKILSRAGLG